ncbi:uncharacterized protein LOC134538525 isoform X3 [Bacillus rossius redtenbacheri]|uniref:uncharacterized protein LOC134538525 isoform X3 n=1 Tax=Bacillus rossius redtenbacheri TaxID=93214 RepID=UPI002FDD6226
MANGVCIEQDPARPRLVQTEILSVKEEIKSEDEADGEWPITAPAPAVKEEVTVEDFQACEQLAVAAAAASLSVSHRPA